MWLLPGSETVPYHVAWATFALCYGLEPWRPVVTATGLVLYTVVSGAILVDRVVEGTIDWQETAEIPLMSLLIALMVWHVQRRQRLLSEVTRLADRERAGARARELLTQRTSHEMRSPLTIASGYLEVLMARHHDAETTDDLSVIHEELARLNRACDRLVRSLRVEQPLAVTAVDVDALVAETVHRWTPVADRSWLVAARAGVVDGSAERLRACLDTLVENAIRYTSCGGTIEVYARRESDQLVVGVADSGPGFSDQFIEAVTDAHSLDVVDGARDDLSQTGLGIGLVVDVARLRGGQVVVGRSAHGGADIALRVPVHPPQSTPWSPGLERRVVPRGLVTS
jgi:signal transduction histidine kinase